MFPLLENESIFEPTGARLSPSVDANNNQGTIQHKDIVLPVLEIPLWS